VLEPLDPDVLAGQRFDGPHLPCLYHGIAGHPRNDGSRHHDPSGEPDVKTEPKVAEHRRLEEHIESAWRFLFQLEIGGTDLMREGKGRRDEKDGGGKKPCDHREGGEPASETPCSAHLMAPPVTSGASRGLTLSSMTTLYFSRSFARYDAFISLSR